MSGTIEKTIQLINPIIGLVYATYFAFLSAMCFWTLMDALVINAKDYTRIETEDIFISYGKVGLFTAIWAYRLMANSIRAFLNRKLKKEYWKYIKRELFWLALRAFMGLVLIMAVSSRKYVIETIMISCCIFIQLLFSKSKGKGEKI